MKKELGEYLNVTNISLFLKYWNKIKILVDGVRSNAKMNEFQVVMGRCYLSHI